MNQNCKIVEAVPISISESVDNGRISYRFVSRNRIIEYHADLNGELVNYYLENYDYQIKQQYYATYIFGSKKQT